MLTVKELARETETKPHTVRYYTRKGLLHPVRHPDNNYRLYKLSDVRWLRFVKQAKQLGFSLSEIKEILRDASHGESPCPRVREILRSHIEENRKQIESLFKLQERMEHALDQWDEMTDKMPDGQTVCHLIETIVDVGGVGDD